MRAAANLITFLEYAEIASLAEIAETMVDVMGVD
jgi:hypothetical protein